MEKHDDRPARGPFPLVIGGWVALILALHLAALTRGWGNLNLPGHEFRQAQTALSAYFIQQEGEFVLAYPTPVLGKPWSIPFEFPLYQWTAVALSEITGYPLTQSGRLVSAACFFLALPAVWLLLGRLGVPGSRRWIVLGVVLSCPLYAFYGRAFLIETMALMFSLWFLQGFVAAVERRSGCWLVVANLAGVGAGLVKVTTFAAYLIPAAVFALWLAGRERGAAPVRSFGRLAPWVAGAVALPVVAAVWWVNFGDATKALNPSAQFARSAALGSFNFGTLADRLAPATWGAHLHHVVHSLVHPAVLLATAGAVLLIPAVERRRVLLLAGSFAAVLLVFPKLYALHDYYFVATAVLLLVAIGMVVAALADAPGRRWLCCVLMVAIPPAQAWTFRRNYFSENREFLPGGSRLTEGLGVATEPRDVIVAAGMDWNSMLPYYSRRRALMLRTGEERNWATIDRALAALEGETVGALVLVGEQRENRELLDLAVRRHDLDPRPLFRWKDALVFVPRQMRPRAIERLHQAAIIELEPAPLAEASENPLRGREIEVGALLPFWKGHFRGMTPRPVRFFSEHGIGSLAAEGRVEVLAHPWTRLWFQPSPGQHALRFEYSIGAGAHADRPEADATDGATFGVFECRADGSRRELWSRHLAPWRNPSDRGWQDTTVPIEVAPGSEVLLEVGPGPSGNGSYDWVQLGRIAFE